ncbi:S8 family peptidase [Collinsella ihumii]|uniref:S8 family serine peptidase n=1 Tax=Collinsella ihumii TaxID=1720204 RepID=A0AAW7JR88_9ACTN|nr:S8 family serine peptidase [Collinsella ihumii]MDN0070034.1 S8 family serine peptidase [Collinsella ihumii]
MKRFHSVWRACALSCALVAGLSLAPIIAGATAADAAAATDGILITLDSAASAQARSLGGDDVNLLAESEVVAQLGQAGLEVNDSFESQGGQVVLTADTTGNLSDEEALAQARDIEGVADVQYNYVYHLVDIIEEDAASGAGTSRSGVSTLTVSSVNDPFAQISSPAADNNQYWLYSANLDDAWEQAQSDHDITIAVLDSGVDLDHEDLADNILTDLAWDATLEQPLAACEITDCAGHGTMVAGVASAVANNALGIAGASYNADLLPIKVVDNEERQITSADLVKSYEYLFDLVDSGKLDNLRVINMSLGGYEDSQANDEAFHNVIKTALNTYDILTVCAGGNGNQTTTPNTGKMYPADFDECISVTALESDGTNLVWSDYNEFKDISAPGQSIRTTNMSGGFSTASGTSVASPIVSGTVALLYAADPDATPEQVRAALEETAVPVVDEEHDRTEVSGSAGALDAGAAVEQLTGAVEPEPEPDPDPEPEPEPELPFVDVDHKWYYSAIVYVYENDIMHGLSDSPRFAPNEPIVRQDAAVVLYNILGNGEKAPDCGLVDVGQDYYTDAVNWAVAHGYINGYENVATGEVTHFGVGDPLTREQLACIVANIARNGEPFGSMAKYESMPDHDKTSTWAVANVVWAINNQIINGVELGGVRHVAPQNKTTRAEMAAIMMNCLEQDVF